MVVSDVSKVVPDVSRVVPYWFQGGSSIFGLFSPTLCSVSYRNYP